MGNLDSKLSQGHSHSNHHYYSIIEEPSTPPPPSAKSSSGSSNLDVKLGFRFGAPPVPPLWNVKKVNYQNEGKNSLLFEFNNPKYGPSAASGAGDSKKLLPSRHLKLAQNQIKVCLYTVVILNSWLVKSFRISRCLKA